MRECDFAKIELSPAREHDFSKIAGVKTRHNYDKIDMFSDIDIASDLVSILARFWTSKKTILRTFSGVFFEAETQVEKNTLQNEKMPPKAYFINLS